MTPHECSSLTCPTGHRYPSTADLAAFRRAIDAGTHAIQGPTADRPAHDGAWPHELRDGIGTPWSDWLNDGRCSLYADDIGSLSSDARREAAADRSEAFHRIAWEAAGDAGLALDMLAAIAVYVPEPDDPDRLTCDVCGRIENAADLTPDWNGETGAHLSCEAARTR